VASNWVPIVAGTALVFLAACGSDSGGDELLDPGPREGACADSTRVGQFEIALRDTFTAVQGKITDAVTPYLISEVVESMGTCTLMRPPTLFCSPSCGTGTTCDANGACVPVAAGASVGVVTVSGLKAPVEMTASAPVYFYTNTGTLDHPGFDEGDDIVLNASGEGAVQAFALGGVGVAPLSLSVSSVTLDTDLPLQLTWAAPGQADAGTMHINLNIAQHGGTPGWIECDVPDTGSFELPVALTNQLLASGFSGFPSVALTRRSADSVDTEVGCVDLLVESALTMEIEIPGLTSCSDDPDCQPPETCLDDLTCG